MQFKENDTYRFLITLFASVATFLVAIETTQFDVIHHQKIAYLEYAVFGFFLLDYIINILSNKQLHKKLSYLFTFDGIVDFIAIIPFFILIFQLDSLLPIKLICGVFTFLKIARFSDALSIFKDVLISERKSIMASLYLMLLLTFFISTVLYFVEKDANPKGFASILESMWWSIVTLATVGYGDVVPVTALGKFIGAISSIVGLGMFALPAGILANGFAQELARIKSITSWTLVSKVPIFANLDKGTITEISKMLILKRFSKNETILKYGDSGDTMYFILDGEVEVDIPQTKVTFSLKSGDFFGEIALLRDVKRTASIIAKRRCEMLELSAYDLKKLIRYRPEIIEIIEQTAKSRINFD